MTVLAGLLLGLAVACGRPERPVVPPPPAGPQDGVAVPQDVPEDALAKVGGRYLCRADVAVLVPGGITQTDERLWVAAVHLAVDATLARQELDDSQLRQLRVVVQQQEAAAILAAGSASAWEVELARRWLTPAAWRLDRQTQAALTLRLGEEDQAPLDEAHVAERYRKRSGRYRVGEQVRLAEIAVPADGSAQRQTALASLGQGLKELRKGKRFADVAGAISRVPSAAQGGERGWSALADLAPELVAAVDGLKPGQTTGIVATGFGLHILQVLERKQERQLSLEEARPAVIEHLRAERRFALRRQRLGALRGQTPIQWLGSLTALGSLMAPRQMETQPGAVELGHPASPEAGEEQE